MLSRVGSTYSGARWSSDFSSSSWESYLSDAAFTDPLIDSFFPCSSSPPPNNPVKPKLHDLDRDLDGRLCWWTAPVWWNQNDINYFIHSKEDALVRKHWIIEELTYQGCLSRHHQGDLIHYHHYQDQPSTVSLGLLGNLVDPDFYLRELEKKISSQNQIDCWR